MPVLLIIPLIMGIAQTEIIWPIGMGIAMALVGVIGSVMSPVGGRVAQLEGTGTLLGRAAGAGVAAAVLYGVLCVVAYALGLGIANIFG